MLRYPQQPHDAVSQQQLPPQSQSQTAQSHAVQQQSADRLGAGALPVESQPAAANTNRDMSLNIA